MPTTPKLSAHDYLSIPYRIEAHSSEPAPGFWLRHVRYPELPDCSAEAVTITEALAKLERRRCEVIASLLERGLTPPVPRMPLTDVDPEGLMIELKLEHLLQRLSKL
jgi:hypothetical protein